MNKNMSFITKKEAINYLRKSNNEDLRLFQEDIDSNGSKRFYVATENDLYEKIEKREKKGLNSHYYESWLEDTNIVFSLDIDASLDVINFDDLIIDNIRKIIKYAKKFYNYEYKIDDIIVLKTKTQQNKNSSHVIFRGLYFKNHLVCKNFYYRIIKEEKLDYCDPSIYGKTCLRTCFSTKKGRDYPLLVYKLIIDGITTDNKDNYENEIYFFGKTLITTIDEYDKKNEMISYVEKEEDINFNEKVDINENTELETVLNYLPDEYCNEYTKWNRVGMVLFSLDESNYNLFDRWSQKSHKYDKDGIKRIWDGYKNGNFNKGMLGIGSLIYWAKEGGYKPQNKDIEHIVSTYQENRINISSKDKYDIQYLSQDKLQQRLMTPNINKKLFAIQSEKGTGKTSNLIKALFDEYKHTPKSILIISSRRTFGIKLSSDLKKYGFKLYSEIEEQYIYNERVIVQIDSLLRLQKDRYDMIVIDECESLARYISSSHFTKNPKASTIVSNLEFRISDANNVIIMDADLSDRCINYYTNIIDPDDELSKNDIKILINNYTPYQNYTLKYTSYNSWLNEINKKVSNDKKLVIPMASNNKAKDLYNKLKNDYPNKSILLIHKETSDEDKLNKLLSVNDTWINYDVVIYTPTVCMGVSFDVVHFDYIFAYGCHQSLGAQEFCQMMHRVRNPKNNDIYISFDYYKYYDPIEDMVTYEQVEEMLCNDYYLLHHNMDNNLITKKYKREGRERILYYPYKEEPIYDLYVRNSMEFLNDKFNLTASFFGYIKYKNYQYEYYESDINSQIEKELKNIRKERKEEEQKSLVDNILNAKLLTSEEYTEKCMRQDKFMTDNDLYEIKKYNLLKNYGLTEEQLTQDIISKYIDKVMMLTYNNLTCIIENDKQNTNKKLEILKDNSKVGEEFRNCYQEFTFKNKYMYHYYSTTLLKYCGFDINDIDKKDVALEKDDIYKNMNKEINGLTLQEFIENEKYGLFVKFDYRKLINREITNDFSQLLKIVNTIINKQYGIKLKIITRNKTNKKYFLSTDNKWKDLPNGILSKEIKQKNDNDNIIIDDLEGVFMDSDSDDED